MRRQVMRCMPLLAGMLVWGCSSETPAPQPMARTAPTVAPAAADAAGATTVAEYVYDPNKRDPFRSFVRGVYGKDEEQVTTPLERFDLSQLELSAIVWGLDVSRALILDPSGKGYIVSNGAMLGKNKGRVVSIGDNVVVVKETYVDSFDRATTKAVEMRLRNTEGGSGNVER